MRSRVPSRRSRGAVAGAALGGCLVYSLLLLSLIGLASPARYGSQGSRAFGTGWTSLALAGIAAGCATWAIAHRGTHAWLVRKVREPFRHPLEADPAFAGAAHALGAAPAPLKTRFAAGWIWLPAVSALLALAGCLSTAYFAVDAVLARFEVGWQQPVLAAANLLLAWVLLRVAAGRLAVWPLAVGVHREATTGYP
jgi:hypothetical protein